MLRLILRATMAALFVIAAGVVPGTAQQISKQQRAEIEQIVRDYILEHPEIIPEAMDVLRERMVGDMIGAHSQALFQNSDTPVAGNPDGDVVVVEFFDYACGYCKVMLPRIQRALLDDGNIQLRLIEFPILSDASVTAAQAALAARYQGKYTSFHMALMGMKASLTEELIYQVAEDVGLDLDRLKQDMSRPEIGKMINDNRQLARSLRIEGTPAIVVGHQMASGAISYEDLMGMVAKARDKNAKD
jgi:protein-disulfide isomerase